MKNPTLDKIKQAAVAELTAKYGYCGVADGDNTAMLNSGNDTETIIINIKITKD